MAINHLAIDNFVWKVDYTITDSNPAPANSDPINPDPNPAPVTPDPTHTDPNPPPLSSTSDAATSSADLQTNTDDLDLSPLAAAFHVNLYVSTDGVTPGTLLASSQQVTGRDQLSVGSHSIDITADLPAVNDLHVIAVAVFDSTAPDPNPSDNQVATSLLQVLGSSSSDDIHVVQDNLSFSVFVDSANSTPDLSRAAGSFDQLIVSGGEGDDTLTIDCSGGNPLSAGGLQYDGGSGFDTISIVGTGTESVSYAPSATSSDSGTLTVNGAVINFRGLEPVNVTGASTFSFYSQTTVSHLSITSNPQSGINTLTDANSPGSWELVNFSNVHTILIDTGERNGTQSGQADDTITVDSGGIISADPNSPTILALAMGAGGNSVTFNGGSANLVLSGGEIDLTLNSPANSQTTLTLPQTQVLHSLTVGPNSNSSIAVNGSTLTVQSLTMTGSSTLTKTGSGTMDVSAGQSDGTSTMNVNGGEVNFYSNQRLAGLNIANGASVTLVQNDSPAFPPYVGGDKYLSTKSLSIGSTSRLELNNNALVIDYSGSSSPLAAITAAITSGANVVSGIAHWDGNGITSSTAHGDFVANASNPLTALGVLDHGDPAVNPGYDHVSNGHFNIGGSGEALPASSVLVKYTYLGDTQLAGRVQFVDFQVWKVAYDANLDGAHIGGWEHGQFDYSETQTTFADFQVWKNAFQMTLAGTIPNLDAPSPSTPLDISMTGFLSRNNYDWVVNYDVLNADAPAARIDVYRSSDGTSLDAIVGSQQLPARAKGKGYLQTITPDFADVQQDYFLIAVINADGDANLTNNRAVFGGGVFQTRDTTGRIIHVHGTSANDNVQLTQPVC